MSIKSIALKFFLSSDTALVDLCLHPAETLSVKKQKKRLTNFKMNTIMMSTTNPIKKGNSEMLRAQVALPRNLGNRAIPQVEEGIPSISLIKAACSGPYRALKDMVVPHNAHTTGT